MSDPAVRERRNEHVVRGPRRDAVHFWNHGQQDARCNSECVDNRAAKCRSADPRLLKAAWGLTTLWAAFASSDDQRSATAGEQAPAARATSSPIRPVPAETRVRRPVRRSTPERPRLTW